MTIHKEGYRPIAWTAVAVAGLVFLAYRLLAVWPVLSWLAVVFLLLVLLWVISFFRSPSRKIRKDEALVISPADGKVVVIEQVRVKELDNQLRRQISIFMSPMNVHLNRYPVSGEIIKAWHNPGKYLLAWHPKSSELNERSNVLMEMPDGERLLVRQIAGIMARRIVCYSRAGQMAEQGEELGFIKFGSRVDVFLPLHWEVMVTHGQKLKGGISVLARIARS